MNKLCSNQAIQREQKKMARVMLALRSKAGIEWDDSPDPLDVADANRASIEPAWTGGISASELLRDDRDRDEEAEHRDPLAAFAALPLSVDPERVRTSGLTSGSMIRAMRDDPDEGGADRRAEESTHPDPSMHRHCSPGPDPVADASDVVAVLQKLAVDERVPAHRRRLLDALAHAVSTGGLWGGDTMGGDCERA